MQLARSASEQGPKRNPVRRFGQCAQGTTTLEFALVSVPFFVLIFGLITIALHYFTVSSLEYAVSAAARSVRTGDAQKSKLTMDDLREMVCENTAGYVECNEHFTLHVKSGSSFADLNPPVACLKDGKLASAQAGDSLVSLHSGAGSATVLVTACYHWTLGDTLWGLTSDLFGIASPQGETTVISATTTFRTEPYQ